MEKPPYLKKGDQIALISTARKISREEVQLAIDVLKGWGLVPVLGKNLFEIENQFAGSITQRVSDLQGALDCTEINAILCARGGYGTVQLIDKIDFSRFIKNPKWIIGYSDVTVLHNHVNENFRIASLHATMPINFSANTEDSLESLRSSLFGKELSYTISSSPLNRGGQCEGVLVGGNLSIIYSLTGTYSQLSTKGKILFIEDLDEYVYHIDRMMMNLQRTGMLDQLAGLIVGGMSDMNDNPVPFGETAQEIIWKYVKDYSYPVCFDFPAGHIDDNSALIFGGKVKLTINEGVVDLKEG